MLEVEDHVLTVLKDGPARFTELHRLIKPSFPSMSVKKLADILGDMWFAKTINYDEDDGYLLPSPLAGDPTKEEAKT